MSTIPAANEQV